MGGCAKAEWEAEWERRMGCDTGTTCCEQELPQKVARAVRSRETFWTEKGDLMFSK